MVLSIPNTVNKHFKQELSLICVLLSLFYKKKWIIWNTLEKTACRVLPETSGFDRSSGLKKINLKIQGRQNNLIWRDLNDIWHTHLSTARANIIDLFCSNAQLTNISYQTFCSTSCAHWTLIWYQNSAISVAIIRRVRWNLFKISDAHSCKITHQTKISHLALWAFGHFTVHTVVGEKSVPWTFIWLLMFDR